MNLSLAWGKSNFEEKELWLARLVKIKLSGKFFFGNKEKRFGTFWTTIKHNDSVRHLSCWKIKTFSNWVFASPPKKNLKIFFCQNTDSLKNLEHLSFVCSLLTRSCNPTNVYRRISQMWNFSSVGAIFQFKICQSGLSFLDVICPPSNGLPVLFSFEISLQITWRDLWVALSRSL